VEDSGSKGQGVVREERLDIETTQLLSRERLAQLKRYALQTFDCVIIDNNSVMRAGKLEIEACGARRTITALHVILFAVFTFQSAKRTQVSGLVRISSKGENPLWG